MLYFLSLLMGTGLQVSAAVRKMQEEVEARQRAEAEAARLAEEQRIRVCTLPCITAVLLGVMSTLSMACNCGIGLHVLHCTAPRVLQCVVAAILHSMHELHCTAYKV